MRSFVVFTFIVCVANCFNGDHITTRSSTPENQGGLGVYGGKDIPIQKMPYMAAIIVNGAFRCSGTIVCNKYVCSSGDCIEGYSPSDLRIIVGSNDGTTGTEYRVNKTILHPQYGSAFLDWNLGCIEIIGNITWSDKVQPAKLPKKQSAPNTTMSVAGYGDTGAEDESEANGKLKGGVMKWQSTKFCQKAYKDFGFKWTPRMGCLYNKGKTTLCHGDFGCPAMKKDVWYASYIAIASQGICSKSAKPCIVSNTQKFTSWLIKNTCAKYED